MRIPRLLLRRLLVWFGVLVAWLVFLLYGAPAAAQSANPPQFAPAPPQPLTLSQPSFGAAGPFWDSRTQIPKLIPHAKGGSSFTEALPQLNWNTPKMFSLSPKTLRRFQLAQPLSPPVLMSHNQTNGERCYTIREYQFRQEDPTSDATTFKDYAACAPSTQFRLKGATLAR